MENITAEKLLIRDADIPWTDLGSGVKRKIISHDDRLMMVKVAFETGGVGSLHHHFHTQLSYVASGRFELTIGSYRRVLEAGDAYYVPPDMVHGALCLEKGELIDIFSPRRDDFL